MTAARSILVGVVAFAATALAIATTGASIA